MLATLYLASCLTLMAQSGNEKATDEQPKQDDAIVAVMDSKKIFRSDVEPDEKALGEVKPANRERTIKQMRASALRGKIGGPLVQEYAEKHKIKATDDEIDSFNEHADETLRKAAKENPEEDFPEVDNDDPEAKAAKRKVARWAVETWKVSKQLYEEFGGDVIFQQGNPNEPIGAYRKLLERAERKGRFKITDRELRDDFWAYFNPEGHSVIPKEMADKMIEKPWWEQKPAEMLRNKATRLPAESERR